MITTTSPTKPLKEGFQSGSVACLPTESLAIMEKSGSKTNLSEKLWQHSSSLKKGGRKASLRLYCWICVFALLFVLLACPGLDPLERKYVSLEYAAYFDKDHLDVCRGRQVYMYDLPPEFNVFVHNESLCKFSLMRWLDLCPRFGHGGYGLKLWNESASEPDADFDRSQWYDTDSYMLEMIYHTRMQRYSCLTNDTSQADAFFIPYYTGLHALKYLYERQDLEKTYEKRNHFGNELIEWLGQNGGDAWRRYGGRDHFLVMGRTTWDFKLHQNWGTGFSKHPYVANMTNLLLESRPDLKNEQAIPYPTSFHPDSPERLRKWIDGAKRSDRKYLFSYVGAPRPDSRSVRGIMSSACKDAGESVCNMVNCSVVRCSHDPVSIYKSFLQANFCLQPRGDTATRRSTFDCLISGAIPVFFHKDTAYTQYSWHLPRDPNSYSVFISEEDIKRGASILDILRSYSQERINEMRRTIVAIIPNLLYNDYDNDLLSPTKDAFEVGLSSVLSRIADVKKEMDLKNSCWFPFISRNCFSMF